MFCPTCGKSDQIVNSYCRSCGEVLIDSNAISKFNIGGITPQQNIKVISFLSFFASIISLLAGVWMYYTSFNVPIALFLGAAVLLCNAGWHISIFIVGMKLRKRLKTTSSKVFDAKDEIQFNTTKTINTIELLPEARFADYVPITVTEKTTKNLKVER